MELVLYFFVMALLSVSCFWFCGLLYGLIRQPAIYFPFSLACKMAAGAVFGAVFFMVGGVILSTMILNGAMSLRDDYRRVSTLVAGAIISTLCSGVIYVSAFYLAWEILD